MGRSPSSQRGQSMLEWAAVLLVVGAVVLTVVQGGLPDKVARGVECNVEKVFGAHAACAVASAPSGGSGQFASRVPAISSRFTALVRSRRAPLGLTASCHGARAASAGEGCPAPGIRGDPKVAAGLAAVAGALAVVVKKCIDRGGCPNHKDREDKRHEEEEHHIVAVNAARAERGRQILTAVGMTVQDNENKLPVPTSFHNRLHSNAYYLAVNETLQAAYDAGSTKAQRHNDVWNALWLIKQEIQRAVALAG